MKNEDPYNPFSSNYNGHPVGPDSFGGSDEESHYASNMSVEKIREELNKMKQESMSNRHPDLGDPEMIALNQIKYEIAQEKLEKKIQATAKIEIKPDKGNHGWIQTFTGKKFFPVEPNVKDICIRDIAHSLAYLCRFTGHIHSFYSVAQHSVLVSYLVSKECALAALLHDASEAYLQDIPKPLKRLPLFEEYRKLEHKLQAMIFEKFNWIDGELPEIKEADVTMLATEARDLLGGLHPEWVQPCEPLPFTIKPLPPHEAEEMFLNRFTALVTKESGYEQCVSFLKE